MSVKILTIKWEQNHLKFLAQGSPPFLKSVCIFSSWVNNCWSCGTLSSILSERKGKREEERKKVGQEGLRKKGHGVRGCEEEKNASKTASGYPCAWKKQRAIFRMIGSKHDTSNILERNKYFLKVKEKHHQDKRKKQMLWRTHLRAKLWFLNHVVSASWLSLDSSLTYHNV